MTYRFAHGISHWYIPDRMMPGLTRWIEHGIKPGNFLCYVLANDFVNAAGAADKENLLNLQAYAAFLYNDAPRACWGSEKKMDEWQKWHKNKNKQADTDTG